MLLNKDCVTFHLYGHIFIRTIITIILHSFLHAYIFQIQKTDRYKQLNWAVKLIASYILAVSMTLNFGHFVRFLSNIATNGYDGELSFKVVNQKNELKEIYDEKDVISGRQFSIEIINKGFSESKFTGEISDFLKNSNINNGKITFVPEYCYVEFKVTNLFCRDYRTGSRDGEIKATKV